MRRWMLVPSAAAPLTMWFDALGGAGVHAQAASRVFVYLAAACAAFLVCGLCVLFITAYAYVYVYLTTHAG